MTSTSSNNPDLIWRSIDSAPKDGTPILCYTPNPFGFGFADVELIDVLWWEADSWQYASKPAVFQPTHWMPVPKPPEPKTDAPQGYARAAIWYRRAAKQGDANAQLNLGSLYDSGQGVQRNRVIAYALFNIAAQAIKAAGTYHNNLEKQITPSGIAAAQALSVEMARPGNLTAALDAYLAHPVAP